MKRAVPQDANPSSLSAIAPLSAVSELESAEDPSQQTLPEANRRVRTSAAMLGLAISVGAYGLVAPRQGDAAVAAEPTTSDPASDNADAGRALEVPTVVESATPTSVASSTTHTVQEGQTLWKIAELYGIDAAKLANMNGLQPNVVLQVGQVLQVPAGNQTATAIQGLALKSLPDLKAVPTIPAQPTAVQSEKPAPAAQPVREVAKEQKAALQDLKQNRDRLKQSLAELKSEESKTDSRVASVPASVTASNWVSYQVNPGDTLSSIAQAHGISVTELAKLNQLSNPNLVKASQVIRVPQVVATQSTVVQPEVASTESTSSTVQVPTVPSLASTQNATSADLPLAVGGDEQQFAFRPGRNSRPSGESSSAVDASPRSNDQYVNNLMSEIARLRQRYQNRDSDRRETKANSATPALFNSASRRVNPQFRSRQTEALRTQSRSATQNAPAQTRLERMLADAPKPRTQVVAAAPLGSESYKPILRSPVGKTVSPNLPPLGDSENYIPGAQFRGYVWPAKGVLTSGYGWRWGRMHKGIDIAAPVGTPIVAAAQGRVITAGWNDGGYGYLVEIEHPDGSVTLYAHNSRILVRVGQQVRQGQQIALMGSTGFSTGPHSHFEVHLPGRGAVNPIAHLPQSRS